MTALSAFLPETTYVEDGLSRLEVNIGVVGFGLFLVQACNWHSMEQ